MMMGKQIIRRAPDGEQWVLQDRWLRITQNPMAPLYPKTGQTITIKSHGLVKDGSYVVEQVEEFEPGFHHDEDGRDIRISLLGVYRGRGLHGPDILAAMEKAVDQISPWQWRRLIRRLKTGKVK